MRHFAQNLRFHSARMVNTKFPPARVMVSKSCTRRGRMPALWRRINRKFTPNQTIQILLSARTGDLSVSDTTGDDCEINRNGAERFIPVKQLR
jgi:hypothetical protein